MISKNYNLVIAGYGGQGVITLTDFIAKLALEKGFDVLQSEIHGLAQRGGSVQTQIRFGPERASLRDQNLFSPKIKRGDADLILGLDFLEAARSGFWSNSEKTIVLSDSEIFWPYDSKIDRNEIKNEIEKISKILITVDASKIASKIVGTSAASNVYLLGKAIKLELLPFEKEKAWEVIEKSLSKEYLESNKKVFEKAFDK